ncbi:hypothetical protein TB1_024722 [Malus domestica]
MDNISPVSRGWRLCIVASCISCIIPIFFLKHSHDSINLSTLGNIDITSTISINESDANIQFLQQGYFEEHVTQLNEEDKCNIFDGKWVYDPKGSPMYKGAQCPFLSDQVSCQRNGRSDFIYEKWSWEAKGCKIPRFDATDMLERLRGKRVIIVGDSLNRNQWESLACLLYSALPPSQTLVDVKSGIYKVFTAKVYNFSVEFYWSPFLMQQNVNQDSGARILRLDRVATSAMKWIGADIMVFNTGHWWVHHGKIKTWDLFQYEGKTRENMEIESAFDTAMNTWARWVDQNVDATKTRVFFRSISPEHKGKHWCYNETQPIEDDSYETTFPGKIIKVIERTMQRMKTPVTYLNITKLSQHRRDAHPAVYATKEWKQLLALQNRKPETYADCSHWCLPGLPDTWNRLLYVSLVLDTSKVILSS